MAVDPRTPVVVGVGQVLQRPDDPADAAEPAALMAGALRIAQADSGATSDLLARADAVRVVGLLSWRYADPGAAVAGRVGATPRQTLVTATGGNGPQLLVNRTCADIQRGDVDVVLVAGAEAVHTRRRARQHGVHLDWTPMAAADEPSAPLLGEERAGVDDAELSHSLAMPTQVYPVFENALRGAWGEGLHEHRATIAGLWARFSEVAADNPYAWSPEARTAEEIATPSSDNRMIGYPYTKLLNANIDTDQGAALILCSLGAARAAGVPDDRLVFPLAGADANDHWLVSSRADLHSSPAIRVCGRAALAAARIGIDDVAHVDLYSCFPSAVQIGAAELGLDLGRPLTVTGGLTFAGGPGNNYVTHSVATMTDVLRRDPGSVGLITALGWYVTKHSVGLYSTTPPARGFTAAHPQDEVDALPARDHVREGEGPATIESFTVMHERDGSPALGIVASLLPGGRRAWATSTDADLLNTLEATDLLGAPVRLDGRGGVTLKG